MKDEIKLVVKSLLVVILLGGVYNYFENSKRNQQLISMSEQLKDLAKNKYALDKLTDDERKDYVNVFNQEFIVTNKTKNRYSVSYKSIPMKLCQEVISSQKNDWKAVNQIAYTKLQDAVSIDDYCSLIEEKEIDLNFVKY